MMPILRRQSKDVFTADMFEVPQPIAPYAGALDCRVQIAHIMSDALKGHDRYAVAMQMGKLLGRDFSKNILDAYTAESREEHIPPIDTAMAFDMATGGMTLLNFYAHQLGARLVVGKENLNLQLGKLENMREELARQIKQVKHALGEQV